MEDANNPAPADHMEGRVGEMTPDRAIYFLERFKRDEKMLGPNEQWALDFAIAKIQGHGEEIAQLNAMVDAWEALPGGGQVRNRDVEKWLADDMTPAINNIRGFLRRPKPDGVIPPAPAPNTEGRS